MEPSGQGRLLYDAGELDVTALVTDQQGNLYAGTSPDGKIYKIAPDGRETALFDPPDKYIWSLAFDPASSTLYAGTGDKGVIYRIDQAGKANILADTNETNIVSLAVSKGNLLAGTDPSGLVLRVSPDGKTFALFDSPTQEIHSLSVADDGSIFALGINQQGGAARQSSAGVSSTTSVSGEGVITISTDDAGDAVSSSVQTADVSGMLNQSRSRNKADGARSAVFRILAEGGSEVYWSATNAVGFALKSLPNGACW